MINFEKLNRNGYSVELHFNTVGFVEQNAAGVWYFSCISLRCSAYDLENLSAAVCEFINSLNSAKAKEDASNG